MALSDYKRRKLDIDNVNNTRISSFEQLVSPKSLINGFPASSQSKDLVLKTRFAIEQILLKNDPRMIFIVGPCSIHDIADAKAYACELKKIADRVASKILIIMRVYFEKPRTTIGWKGFINDPDLDNTFNVNKGLSMARKLLIDINDMGLPCGYEILDTITPQYISDLISWGAIGARTTESQVHRQLVSGLSMPVGFKNGTGGDVKIAAEAIVSASFPHCFMGITASGEPAICKTKGHPHCHAILRGGSSGPNFSVAHVKQATKILAETSGKSVMIIDCSHGNSGKIHTNQPLVLNDVIKQRVNGNLEIVGIMLESNLRAGKQKHVPGMPLQQGVSITDSCIDIATTRTIIDDAFKMLGGHALP